MKPAVMARRNWLSNLKNLTRPVPVIAMMMILYSCSAPTGGGYRDNGLFEIDNLVAWCIVPFDAMERTPEERAVMLDQLGFRRMAWDWRMEHIDLLPQEIEVLKNRNIELTAVWAWLDNPARVELPSQLERIFNTIEESGTKTTYWVSFSDNYFDGLSDGEKVQRAAGSITDLHDRVRRSGCKIALYNHMGWFGEPENQVRIIETIGRDSIGIVYNFHHAHHHIDDFPMLLEIMMPYLYTVNLNGMNREGPKILDIGSGDHEESMIKALRESGFTGTIGIIGHTDGEDIRVVLERNLDGLQEILNRL
jgi:sugar phosphate isomerase/epimerase